MKIEVKHTIIPKNVKEHSFWDLEHKDYIETDKNTNHSFSSLPLIIKRGKNLYITGPYKYIYHMGEKIIYEDGSIGEIVMENANEDIEFRSEDNSIYGTSGAHIRPLFKLI